MKAAPLLLLLATAVLASAQTIDSDAASNVISGYTGGTSGTPSQTYLTTLATTLATGFISSMNEVVQNVQQVIHHPEDFSDLCDQLESSYCTIPTITGGEKYPASIVGPEVDISFSAGACLVNETKYLDGNGNLEVECVAPAINIEILPAKLTSPYKSAVVFTDKECQLSKEFGEESDNVVFVLEKGAFNISGLVSKVETDLSAVLGQFSSMAGSVVSTPNGQPILDGINAATALLG